MVRIREVRIPAREHFTVIHLAKRSVVMFSIPRTASIAALFICFAAPSAAHAAPAPTPSPSPSASPLQTIGQTIETADRHSEPITNTTRPTYIVDRAHIEDQGDRTIADALVGVPGVEIYHYGAFGSQAGIFIHGSTSATQVLVLLDGIPISPASSGALDLGSFSTSGVRRVEIVEGGGSTLYGSSAIGGIVNIITGIPRGVYLETSGGSYGDQDVRIDAGTGTLGVSFERHIAQNDYGYAAEPQYPAGTRENAWAEQTTERLSYDTDLSSTISAHLRLGSNDIGVGVPGDLAYGTTPDARQVIAQNDARLELLQTTAQSTTSLNLSGSRQQLPFFEPSDGPEQDTFDSRTQLSLRHTVSGDQFTLTTGIDLSRETALITNGAVYDPITYALEGYFSAAPSQAQSALYAQEQYAAPNGVRAVAGLRAEHDAGIESVVEPSFGFALPLGRGVRLTFNGSGAFSVPSIDDLYFPGYANPSLQPERSSDGDITLSSDRVLGGAAVTLFGREVTNLIQFDADVQLPENVYKASIRGLQGTIRTHRFHGTTASLSVTDTYRALDLSNTAARLSMTPTFTGTLTLDHAIGKGAFGFGAVAQIFGGPHLEGVAPYQTLNGDAPTTVDAYLRARLAPNTLLTLRARNLGDEHYQSIIGYPAPGRTFYVELATR